MKFPNEAVQQAWEMGVSMLPRGPTVEFRDFMLIRLIKDYTRFVDVMRQTRFLEDREQYPIHIQAISNALVATKEYQRKLAAKIEGLEQSIPILRETFCK